jgi:hypothetical protein
MFRSLSGTVLILFSMKSHTENRLNRVLLLTAVLSAAFLLSCSNETTDRESSTTTGTTTTTTGSTTTGSTYSFGTAVSSLWKYNSTAGIYYITGLYYCSSPADSTYESLALFVPAAYMSATANSDGTTYTCTINSAETVNGYTAATAPVVMPVNTAGYAAQSSLTAYDSSAATYTAAGFIYLYAGCRGRTHGAPTGVTDLKAAVRYFRYLQATQSSCLPGDADRIFSFGHSGGGAQSAVLGASGDSTLYTPYLTAIGAVTSDSYSDAVCGSMCWCPITNLDYADGAYEWNMGLTRSSLSSDSLAVSKGLSASFATYINDIGFVDSDYSSSALTLTATSDGYYQAGTYYDYLLSVINESVSNYNSDNSKSVAAVTSLETFAASYKNAAKGLGAFDNITSKSQAENTLMGISGTAGHFDTNLASIIKSNTTYASYYSDFTSDLSSSNTDSAGNTVATRLKMYTPLYYLVNNTTYYGGYNTSTPAKYWRIRTGIEQTDTALCTEVDLYLALKALITNSNALGVTSVDFATVWNQGHTEAERTGTYSANFISWVEDCCQ